MQRSRIQPDAGPTQATSQSRDKARDRNNVKVICRFRPENEREKSEGGARTVDIEAETGDGQSVLVSGDRFTLDRIYDTKTAQEDIYSGAAKEIVESVMDGYNGTVFAYGQTGSGKTFTMDGPDIRHPELRGITPRMVSHVFDMLMNAPAHMEFTIKVSLIEIYLEKIRDLLDASKTNLQVHEDKVKGVYIDDVTEEYVGSAEEVYEVMRVGREMRATASTNMNDQSSRSHSIFIMEVRQIDRKTESVKTGKLFLVDLAGSEKVGKTNASGSRLEEAKNINKSLSALGNVINALTDAHNTHVPYRDSKLTRILQQSLGGNAKTCLVVACSPSSWNEAETISTLRFAVRAKMIKNKAKVNQEFTAAQLKLMLTSAQAEIDRLNEMLASGKGHAGDAGASLDTTGKQSEEDKWNMLQLHDALLEQLKEKTTEANQSKAEVSDLRREINRTTLSHDEELQQLKRDLAEKKAEFSREKRTVASLEERVRRGRDELKDKDRIIEMLTAPKQEEDDDLDAQSRDDKIAELEALVDLQRTELRELEKMHAGGEDGGKDAYKTSLTDLLAAKEVENEKYKARVKEQEARSNRFLTMIRQHQEREKQFQKIVQQLNQAHESTKEKLGAEFQSRMQDMMKETKAEMALVCKERDALKQSVVDKDREYESLERSHMKLANDVKDRCDKVIELEMALDREKDQNENILEKGGIKSPKSLKRTVDFLQRNLEQYSNVCQQLLIDNHQLNHKANAMELDVARKTKGLSDIRTRFDRVRQAVVSVGPLKEAAMGQGVTEDDLRASDVILAEAAAAIEAAHVPVNAVDQQSNVDALAAMALPGAADGLPGSSSLANIDTNTHMARATTKPTPASRTTSKLFTPPKSMPNMPSFSPKKDGKPRIAKPIRGGQRAGSGR